MTQKKVAITEKGSEKIKGYSGIYNCHKYWGKKPVELYELILDKFTKPGDLVSDPFMGSGVLPSVCRTKNINFNGCDLNPAAIDVAEFFISPPSKKNVIETLDILQKKCQEKIDKTYTLKNGVIVSHLVWIGSKLDEAWTKQGRGIQVIELTEDVVKKLERKQKAKINYFKDRELHKNSRINVSDGQKVSDLFTERALENIDVLLGAIAELTKDQKKIARFILSSALGQMSRMVFTITNRSKNKGVNKQRKYEVGSWVIGYWRPKTYFEINVWQVFQGRAKRLINALPETQIDSSKKSNNVEISIVCDDAVKHLSKMKSKSVDLVVTDPPHSDRIPYLELSEMWNTFLGYRSAFKSEFIYSNSSAREKSLASYLEKFDLVFDQVGRILKDGGTFILIFNTTEESVWDFIKKSIEKSKHKLCYRGRFSANYSANSVVQDNRDGALKNDWCLVITKGDALSNYTKMALPSWNKNWG